jgi:hypothetical protein
MSVIFETLQKLNRSVAKPETETTSGRPRRKVYAFKAVLLSPVTVTLLVLVVSGLGYGLVYGLRQLQPSAQMDPKVLATAGTPMAEAAPQAVPPPPDVRHLEADPETPPAKVPAHPGAEVPPPSAEAVATLPSEGAFTPPGQDWVPPTSGSGAAYAAAPAARALARGMPPGSENAFPEYDPAESAPIAPEQEDVFSGMKFAAIPHEMRPAPRPGGETAASAEPAAFEEDEAATQAQAAVPPPFRRSPIPRYTRLVQRLQTAIVSGDGQAADRLVDEFAAAKGKGHPYLTKIQAYRRIQAGDYERAETLLKRVLALDETDRDAQMNLAVVEANTGRVDAARRRVTRLAVRFPEDETVAAMGRQLD